MENNEVMNAVETTTTNDPNFKGWYAGYLVAGVAGVALGFTVKFIVKKISTAIAKRRNKNNEEVVEVEKEEPKKKSKKDEA